MCRLGCSVVQVVEVDETPKPGDPLFEQVENRVIATAHRSLEAAADVFRSDGIHAGRDSATPSRAKHAKSQRSTPRWCVRFVLTTTAQAACGLDFGGRMHSDTATRHNRPRRAMHRVSAVVGGGT